MVDTGSSADILYLEAFNKMALARSLLKPVSTPLVGFGGEVVTPEGSIDLPVTFGESPAKTTIFVNFLVVDRGSAYNAILGRPSLNKIGAALHPS